MKRMLFHPFLLDAGRGLVKKVLVPFLLGLKFKTTVLLPLAFALIALKAWKALTLGLISLVVSTAVVVFKLAKPKVNKTIQLSLEWFVEAKVFIYS